MKRRVSELESIAQQLAARVREDDPEANGRWLASQLPDPADWWRLLFIQAAATPVDRPWSEVTAWAQPPAPRRERELRPHGTDAALRRHQYRREPACEDCKAWDRQRKHDARQKHTKEPVDLSARYPQLRKLRRAG